MTERELAQVLAPVVEALTRIAVALETWSSTAAPAQEASPSDTAAPQCLHPLESRIDFGTTNGLPDWQCRICQYRSLS